MITITVGQPLAVKIGRYLLYEKSKALLTGSTTNVVVYEGPVIE